MNKKRKNIVVLCFLVVMIGCAIFWLITPKWYLKINPDNVPITITFYSYIPDDKTSPHNTEIVVKQRGLFGSTLLRDSFNYYDGARHDIQEDAVTIVSENNEILIIIGSDKMRDIVFEVPIN